MCQPPCRGRNADKGLSDGMERTGGKPSRFHGAADGAVDGAVAKREPIEGYRAEKFIEYTDGAEPLTEMDTDFMLKTLVHIKVFEDGTLLVVFLDGTEIECKNEEE